MSDPLQSWSESYSRALGQGPSPRTLSAERARLLLAHRAHPKKSAPIWGWVASGTLVLALSTLAFSFFWSRPPRLEQAFLGETLISQGTSIESSVVARTLAFSGGTEAQLNPGAQLKLQEISEQRVMLQLETGLVNFDVQHREGTEWVIFAGDYRVTVIGTAFTVDRNERVKVHVARGKVRVEGGTLPPRGLFLVAGERFVSPLLDEQEPKEAAASGSHQAEPSPTPRSDEPVSPSAQIQPKTKTPETKAKPEASLESTSAQVHHPKADWRALAQEGKFAPALAAARRQGMKAVIQDASGADLLLLGNAARYGGDFITAATAYQKARKRAPGSSAAALSAYYLSRLSIDQQGDPVQAIRWLRTFLAEQSSGALAASARARLMTLLETRGDLAGAKQVARAYLQFHPGGPHSDRAQRMLGSSRSHQAD